MLLSVPTPAQSARRVSSAAPPGSLATRAAAFVGTMLAAALVWGGLGAAPARASFLPIVLQSVGPTEQFVDASEPAISGNGEYLVFAGDLAGVGGIWRKDLTSGRLQYVAAGGNPSISADGRYVSFNSDEQLVTEAHPGRNVYVRDMALEPAFQGACGEAQESAGKCPYELASALNESSEGLTYHGGGASASARISLSADGREVAFVLGGESNLTSERGGSTEGKPTPSGQIAVRYLNTHRTVLVTTEREADGQMSTRPVAEGAMSEGGAALSGDGSTVAWLGAHIPAQAPTLEGERRQIESDEQPSSGGAPYGYDEPLWRRIADGATPTRRMVGGGDPLAPNCSPHGTLAEPACQGPYPRLALENTRGEEGVLHYGWLGIAGYNGIPQLSYDGWTAALVGDPDGTADVFAVDMHEGLDRVQALRELTPEVPVNGKVNPGSSVQYVASAGDVYEVAISPDGSRIAFTTQRQQFLAPLLYGEEPPPQLGIVELYEIVDGETLERVTRGPHGGPSLEAGNTASITDKGAYEPSFTDDNRTIAFADTASNLIFGDVNGASDVFTATEAETAGAGATEIGQSPPMREPGSQWRLSVVAVTHRNGTVTLDVVVPGAGSVRATASAAVPAATLSGVAAGRARSHRAKAFARSAARRRRASRNGAGAVARRTVAAAAMPVATPGLLELPLRVGTPYARLLSAPAGIYATVRVMFTGPGGPALTQTLAVSLHRAARRARKVGKPKARRSEAR